MSQDLHSKLKNHMGYGTITRGQIPGDLEDYTVTLVKEYHKKSIPTLKLVFKLKKNDKYQSDFCVKIDNIIQPAHPMLLIKMSENQGKATAQATNKIKYKMALSVQKQHKMITQIIQKDEQQSDSDIPKGRPISSYFDLSQIESKPRKRKNNEQAEEQQSD